jgi:acetolactate synthase-1/2/3 large subunit
MTSPKGGRPATPTGPPGPGAAMAGGAAQAPARGAGRASDPAAQGASTGEAESPPARGAARAPRPAASKPSTPQQHRSHEPAAGTPVAEAVERARRDMLRDSTVPRRADRARIGADVVCEAIVRQGVDVLWGIPGGVILPLYDVFVDHPDLRTILVRHEQGAAHAADGYARATGRVGVCLGTSGPAATNLVTGLANAQLDSIPVVAITGNVAAALLGKDAFQEIDITGITLPMTKHNYLVRDANDLPRVMAEAFHIARTGRPGPVHVDITKDALQQETDAPHPSDEEVFAGLPGFRPTFDGHPRQVQLIAQEIARAKRPVIMAGHGILIAGAMDELRTLAERARIPVTWTLLGIGAIDETHPLAYGYMGMHGWKHVNRAIQSADLLLALGMRFDDRVTGNVRTYAPHARIVHVDIDPAEIGKNVAVDVPVVGDVQRVLAAVLEHLGPVPETERTEYLDQLAEWRRESEAASWHGSGAWRGGQLSADYVVSQIGEATGHDATLVGDVGQNQMWVARYGGFRRPHSHLSSGGLGTMGYALPAAMGAAVGRPDKETWAICGDGGFQMTIQELATIVQDRIPVKIALLDNHKLGMVRQWQELFYAGNYHSSHLLGPDFVKVAEAYGIPGWKVRTPDEVRPAIDAARAVDGPALVWFEIAEEQNVFPIMPAGKGLSDLIEIDEGGEE